jgi:hypothetical protein
MGPDDSARSFRLSKSAFPYRTSSPTSAFDLPLLINLRLAVHAFLNYPFIAARNQEVGWMTTCTD